MTLNKLQRFAELQTFNNYLEFLFSQRNKAFELKGKWSQNYFKNNHPLVLELGCGKGEYCIGLSKKYPDKNFIGIDIKGARIWRGAKTAIEEKRSNIGFLRTRIDFIEQCFGNNEIDEIWITFPDPQLKKERKRLTHPLFLNRYNRILRKGAVIHLKTDSRELYEFTLDVLAQNNIEPSIRTNDLYTNASDPELIEAASIQTFYEKGYLKEGKKITYIKFSLPAEHSGEWTYKNPKKGTKKQ